MPRRTEKKPSSTAAATNKKSNTSGVDLQRPPAWPLLQPLVPTSDLELQTILQDQIVVVRKFFTRALCQKYISFLSGLPLSTTPGIPKRGEALRVNDRYEVQDPEFARELFESTSLRSLIADSTHDWGGKVCGLNPRIRIYRYAKGQFFDQHYDDQNLIEMSLNPPIKARTTWTLLIYLTGASTGCLGGETVFYPSSGHAKFSSSQNQSTANAISISPEPGLALLHKHGDDCLLHEGKEVTGGEKWIIRSDLCVER